MSNHHFMNCLRAFLLFSGFLMAGNGLAATISLADDSKPGAVTISRDHPQTIRVKLAGDKAPAYQIRAHLDNALVEHLEIHYSEDCEQLLSVDQECQIRLSRKNEAPATQVSPGKAILIQGMNTNAVSFFAVVYDQVWKGCTADFGRGCFLQTTVESFQGDFYSRGGSERCSHLQGRSHADCLCTAEAERYGRPGTWKVLVNDTSSTSPFVEGISNQYPLYSLNQENKEELLAEQDWTLSMPLLSTIVNMQGQEARYPEAWSGGSAGMTCKNWSTTEGNGGIGVNFDGSWWYNYDFNECQYTFQLYCIQSPNA